MPIFSTLLINHNALHLIQNDPEQFVDKIIQAIASNYLSTEATRVDMKVDASIVCVAVRIFTGPKERKVFIKVHDGAATVLDH